MLLTSKKIRIFSVAALFGAFLSLIVSWQMPVYAVGGCSDNNQSNCAKVSPASPYTNTPSANSCGAPGEEVSTALDIGCNHVGSPITDATFAIIRFLSYGVGLVIVASLAFAGIQYTASRDDPKATAAARTRIYSNVVALLLFIFGYAILNYVIPNGFFK